MADGLKMQPIPVAMGVDPSRWPMLLAAVCGPFQTLQDRDQMATVDQCSPAILIAPGGGSGWQHSANGEKSTPVILLAQQWTSVFAIGCLQSVLHTSNPLQQFHSIGTCR